MWAFVLAVTSLSREDCTPERGMYIWHVTTLLEGGGDQLWRTEVYNITVPHCVLSSMND